jgi:hypothetical protein
MKATKKELIAAIADAVESLTPEDGRRDYNPHVVKVREKLRKALRQPEDPESVKRYKATQEFFEDTSCN